jgi:hypothetical protein
MNSRGQAARSHKSGIRIAENPGETSHNGAGNAWEIGQTSDALWTLMTIHGNMPILLRLNAKERKKKLNAFALQPTSCRLKY